MRVHGCSTPDKPIHCIVWAKELHKLLFGDAETSVLHEPEGDSEGEESTSGTDAAATAVSGGESVYMRAVRRPGDETCGDASALGAWSRGVFDAVFRLEIEKKLSMGDTYKTAKHRPTPLVLAECLGADASHAPAASSASRRAVLPGQSTPSVAQCAAAFLSACEQFYADTDTRCVAGSFAFDKDNAVSMRLVAAAANLRAHTFGIPLLSEFEIKSIAGNIVPAVATTNAIVAGLETLEAIRILAETDVATTCSYTNIATSGFAGGRTMLGGAPRLPVAGCHECGKNRVMLRVDTKRVTLGTFLDVAVKQKMRFEAPSVLFQAVEPAPSPGTDTAQAHDGEAPAEAEAGQGSHFSFVQDEDDDKWLAVILADLPAGGITGGKIVTIDDWDLDGAKVEMVVAHIDTSSGEDAGAAMELVGSFSAVEAAEQAATAKASQAAAVAARRAETRAAAAAAAAAAASQDDPGQETILVDDDDDEDIETEEVAASSTAAAASSAGSAIDSPDTSSSGSRKRVRSPSDGGGKRVKEDRTG
jgi:ubiquitin-like 1-activating enzyme E1 B